MKSKINEQKYSKDSKGKFLFIRHGQTVCNSDKNYKERKINPDYLDSHLSKKGIKQTKELNNTIKHLKIETIYESPLYRSLETVKYMLEGSSNFKGEIIVHPLIIECPNCIDDFIYDINETKNDFKDLNVNWSIFEDYVKKYQNWIDNFYYFEYFNRLSDTQKKIKHQKLLDLYKKKDMDNLKKEIVNEMPKIIFRDEGLQPFESFKHVYSRFLEFKNFLSEKHKDSLDNFDSKVIIVTHGDFLGVITNKYLYENDDVNAYARDCCHCKNCDIISIYI